MLLTLGGLLITTFGACRDDPTSPQIIDVSGTWNGTLTITHWTPAGHCIADFFNVHGGLPSSSNSLRMVISQNGSALEATISDEETGTEIATAQGTVSSSGRVEMSIQITGRPPCFPTPPCVNGTVFDACPQSDTLSGSVSGTTMTGVYLETVETTNLTTGEPGGTVEVNGTFTFNR